MGRAKSAGRAKSLAAPYLRKDVATLIERKPASGKFVSKGPAKKMSGIETTRTAGKFKHTRKGESSRSREADPRLSPPLSGPPTSSAVEILRRRLLSTPEARAQIEEMRADAEVAQQIYDLRTAANLTQQQLGELVGTTASVICRLEGNDYEGHSLSMLRRIAKALGRRVVIGFPPAEE